MGRSSTGLTSFCLSQIGTRIRLWSPTIESNPDVQPEQHLKPAGNEESECSGKDERGVLVGHVGRRVMMVVESNAEAKFALQWALSHAVQSNDTVVLLDVARRTRNGDQTEMGSEPKDYELLNAMKSICQAKRPEVQVELSLVDAKKDRGPTIVEEARKQNISLLILGQKRRSIAWRLLMMWASKRKDGGVVEYCVQNAACMALAVRRKSSRGGGGYLITTRRQKDFWLLA